MPSRPCLPALAAALLCATALSGCLTPHVQPTLSKAVVQARAGAQAQADACPAGDLASVSPADMDFGFDDATITEVGQKRLTLAARWLACHPGVAVVIKPDADHHGAVAHLNDLAQRRAQAVQAQLRALGATAAVIHILPRNGPDPLTAPHLVVNAVGRGW